VWGSAVSGRGPTEGYQSTSGKGFHTLIRECYKEPTMPTRRGFIESLAGAAAGIWSNGAASTAETDFSAQRQWLREHIIAEFQTLPGRKAEEELPPCVDAFA